MTDRTDPSLSLEFKLRDWADEEREHHGDLWGGVEKHLGYQAAAEIERLNGELERLKRKIDHWRDSLKFYANGHHYILKSKNWIRAQRSEWLWMQWHDSENSAGVDAIEDGDEARKALAGTDCKDTELTDPVLMAVKAENIKLDRALCDALRLCHEIMRDRDELRAKLDDLSDLTARDRNHCACEFNSSYDSQELEPVFTCQFHKQQLRAACERAATAAFYAGYDHRDTIRTDIHTLEAQIAQRKAAIERIVNDVCGELK